MSSSGARGNLRLNGLSNYSTQASGSFSSIGGHISRGGSSQGPEGVVTGIYGTVITFDFAYTGKNSFFAPCINLKVLSFGLHSFKELIISSS